MRVKISQDKEVAMTLALNPICTNRAKNIDVRHHFLGETVAQGEIELLRMSTLEQVASALTKNLRSDAHLKYTGRRF